MVWNLFPFKGDFSLGKRQKSQGTKSDRSRAESPGWFDVLPKNCLRHDAWAGVLSWWSCQTPLAHGRGLLNHHNSFCGGMFKLNKKFDPDSLLYSLSHFECHGHTVHILTQQCLPPLLTSTVTSSLFTHVHSSPLSLAARLHQCHANHSHYINNGWTFSKQMLYIVKWLVSLTFITTHRYNFFLAMRTFKIYSPSNLNI